MPARRRNASRSCASYGLDENGETDLVDQQSRELEADMVIYEIGSIMDRG